jgi:hypothetical protein
MGQNLRSFQDVARELSEKYSVPYEVVENILIDWVRLLHETMEESFTLET